MVTSLNWGSTQSNDITNIYQQLTPRSKRHVSRNISQETDLLLAENIVKKKLNIKIVQEKIQIRFPKKCFFHLWDCYVTHLKPTEKKNKNMGTLGPFLAAIRWDHETPGIGRGEHEQYLKFHHLEIYSKK